MAYTHAHDYNIWLVCVCIISASYVLFIMTVASLSTVMSIIVLYFHHKGARSPMPRFARTFFFRYCATVLYMRASVPDYKVRDEHRPLSANATSRTTMVTTDGGYSKDSDMAAFPSNHTCDKEGGATLDKLACIETHLKALRVYLSEKERTDQAVDDWKAMALVLDRLFFWCTLIVCLIGFPIFMTAKDTQY